MDNRNEKKIVVRLVCVLLSFGLWLYVTNVENPVRRSEIRDVEVELVNIYSLKDSKLVLSPDQNFTVDIKIEGPANNIYRVNKNEFKLKADLGLYALKKGENNVPVQIVDYPEGILVRNNNTISVKVKIDDLVEKEVDVKSDIKVKYKEGFSQLSLDIKTKNIKISGPDSIVKRVEYAALVGELNDIDKDVEQEFDIKVFDSYGNELNGVTLSTKKSIASLKVGKGKDVKLKPTYTGVLRDELKIDTIELSRNTINVIGDSSIIDKLEYLNVEAINLSNITSNNEYTLRILCPEGVKISDNEDYVKVKVKVIKKITKTFNNIEISLVGKDMKYNYQGDNLAGVTISGTEEELANITPDNIKIEGNVDGLGEGDHIVELKAIFLNGSDSVSIKSNPQSINIKISLV